MTTWVPVLVMCATVVVSFSVVMGHATLLSWLERKQSALMQDRVGANRADIFGVRALGIFHIFSDAIKLMVKEDYIPPGGNRFFHTIAPFLTIFFALLAFAAVPIADTWPTASGPVSLQPIHFNMGILFAFAALGMGVYGVVLGAWSSNNKFALLGGLRASAQVISYEIALGISVIGPLMVYGTLDLQEMVRVQGQLLGGFLPAWGILLQPVAAVIFLTAATAESKRIPFDLPEGESEIIGYFVEYSGMKLGMFMMSDFIETVVASGLFVTLFLGGWQIPWVAATGTPLMAVLQFGCFFTKLALVAGFLMTVRWTLVRFRYDQLMSLGWKILFPLALANIAVTGLVLLLLG